MSIRETQSQLDRFEKTNWPSVGSGRSPITPYKLSGIFFAAPCET